MSEPMTSGDLSLEERFPDRRSRMWARRLHKNRYVKAAVESGMIDPGEVRAAVQLWKYNPGFQLLFLVGLAPGIVFGAMQRFFFLFVTDREVIVTPFVAGYLGSAKKSASGALRLQRPVQLALAEDPKPAHNFGNRVQLPREIAEHLDRDVVHAQMGNVADDAFRIARTPSAAPAGAPAPAAEEHARIRE